MTQGEPTRRESEVRVPDQEQDQVAPAARCPPGLKAAQGGKGIQKDSTRAVLP